MNSLIRRVVRSSAVVLPLALISFGSLAFGDLIPAARLTNWTPGTRTGVTGGIPSRTHLIDVTQAPYNADKTGASDATGAIQTAINANVNSGNVIYLPAGTYKIGTLTSKSYCTIRGAGVGETILDVRGGAGITAPLDPSWFATTATDVTGGLTGGSSTITVASGAGFAAQRMARIVAERPRQTHHSPLRLREYPKVRVSRHRR